MTFKKKRISRNKIAYCLLSNQTERNIYIPAKCKIIDYIYNDKVPFYVVQVKEIYEDFNFINKHWISKTIKYPNARKKKALRITSNKNKLYYYRLSDMKDVYTVLNGESVPDVDNLNNCSKDRLFLDYKERHYIAIEEPLMFPTKEELKTTFNQLNEFFMVTLFRDLKLCMTRKDYNGKFKTKSGVEFEQILKNTFDLSNSEFEKYMNMI